MYSSPSYNSSGPSDLAVEIVEALETCGLEHESYQLHDYVDIEALDQLLASTDGNTTVQFTIEEIRFNVSSEGVEILAREQPDSVAR